jgi:hypothetical protein
MSCSSFSHFKKSFSSLKERAGERVRGVRVRVEAIDIAVKESKGAGVL